MLLFVTNLVNHLTYLGIFMGTFIEGPVVGLLAGFFVRIGFLNPFLAYIAHVLGDLFADFFYYSIGLHGKKIFFKKFNIIDDSFTKAEKMKKLFYRHPTKIIILGKLTHITGLPVLLGAGIAHYNWRKFLFFDFLATLIKSAVLLLVGYYLAESWTRASDVISYLSWFGLLFILIIIAYFIMKKVAKNLWKR